jgi:aerobic carbon-monoxide dehydrogenase large subunit
MAQPPYLGQRVKRVEDPRLLTGAGRYTDDTTLPGTAQVAMVRSPFAHARITSIDTARALAHPGVVAVLTGREMVDAKIASLPVGWLLPDLKTPPRYAIAVDTVRHAGEIVAAVLAWDRATAEDAAALVDVGYDPLPAVALGSAALAAGAPQLHAEAAGNVAFEWSIGDKAETDASFARAAKTVALDLRNSRLVPNAIEPRSSLAQYTRASDEFTLWTTTQNPHIHRLLLAAFVMGIPEHKLRVISNDVGGGFGSKIFPYPEEVIVLYASRKLNLPVKWTARRQESFAMDCHGRDHESHAELAVDAQGRVLGLRVKTVANLGAYLSLFAPAVPTYLYGTLMNGTYRFPAIFCEVTGVFSNTTPVDAVRGAGRPEATYLIERMMSRMADELGEDAGEFRRKNFIGPGEFPYQTRVALQYDSGNYEPALDKALAKIDYPALRARQQALRAEGRYIGIGFSSYLEACGLAPSKVVGSLGAQAGQWESAVVRVMPTGKIEVLTGSHSHGQGHETAFAQLVADELQVPMEDVAIVHGDTGKMPFGWGTYGSRSAAVGASAIKLAAGKIRDKATRIAAHLLEAGPDDVEYTDGKFQVKGVPDRSKSWFDVSLQAHLCHNMPEDMEPGLEASHFYDPKNFVFPFGTHIAVVEIDADTGHVRLERYVAVDDCGPHLNPLIVEGQIHGGVAHGTGQALFEEAIYDDQAQLTSGSFLEYTMPRADDLPMFELDHTVTPSPHNPLGVKGIGEAGTIASTAAVANAVIDALKPFGVTHLDMPLTPEKVWRAMRAGRTQAARA